VYGTLLLVGAGAFGVYYMDSRGAIHRYVITPVLRRLFDAETGHRLAVRALAAGIAPRDPIADDEVLRTEVSSLVDYVSNKQADYP
jgi:dihydroorotate dehydrogenase